MVVALTAGGALVSCAVTDSEAKTIAALDDLTRGQARAFAQLAFAESERVASQLGVDAALVRDQFERAGRVEWLLGRHRTAPSSFSRARALRVSMMHAALDVRRRERQRKDPLYAHLEQKYRRLAIAAHNLWIRRSLVGRLDVDAFDAPRGERQRVQPPSQLVPPLPRHVNERYSSRHDDEHVAFIHHCLAQAGGPLAHRQLIRVFLEQHGAAAPLQREQRFEHEPWSAS